MFDHIPNDWELKSLGDVVGVLTDYTANGSFEALRINVQYYYDENYAALVRITDLGKADFIPKVFTDERGYLFQKKTALYGGEIVLANVGSVGKVYRVPKNYPMPMTLAPNTYLVKFNLSEIDETFGYQFLISDFYVKGLYQNISSTTLAAINKSSFRSIKIALPRKKSEQSKIAEILDTIDTSIRETEAIIAKLKAVKQGLLHDLLTRGIDANGELRPPQSQAPHLYKRSPLGWIPKEWELGGLATVAHKDRSVIRTGPFGSSLKGEHWRENGIPVVTIGSLGDGVFIASELLFVDDVTAARLADFALIPSDLVFSRVADVGRSVVISENERGWIMSSNFMRISCDGEKVRPHFLQMLLSNSVLVRKQLRANVNSAGRDVANSAVLLGLYFTWPSPAEQNDILDKVGVITERLVDEEAVLSKLIDVKSALMNDLLTGRVRVTPLLDPAAT